MSFNMVYPPASSREQSSAMPDIVSQLLGGYGDVQNLKSQRLQQQMIGEQLKRAQLMGQYLPEQLKQEAQARRLKAIRDQMDIDWLNSFKGGQASDLSGSADADMGGVGFGSAETPEEENYNFDAAYSEEETPDILQGNQFEPWVPEDQISVGGYLAEPERFYNKPIVPSKDQIRQAYLGGGQGETQNSYLGGAPYKEIPTMPNISSRNMPSIPMRTAEQFPEQALEHGIPSQASMHQSENGLAPHIQTAMGFPQLEPNENALTPRIQREMGAPKPSYDDVMSKRLLGIDTYTPKLRAYEQKQQHIEETYGKAKATEIYNAQHDLPVLENTYKAALKAKSIVDENADLFGHNIREAWGPTIGIGGYAATMTNEKGGYLQSTLIPLIAGAESEMSDRGNIVALKTALGKMPEFGITHEAAKGRINAVVDMLAEQIERNKKIINTKPKGNKASKGEQIGNFYYIDGKVYKQE